MPELDDSDLDIMAEQDEQRGIGGFEDSRAALSKIHRPPLNRGRVLNGPKHRVKLDTPEAIQKAVGRVLKTLFTSTSGCVDLQSAAVFIRGSETLLKDMRRAQELELVAKVDQLEERLKLVVGMKDG